MCSTLEDVGEGAGFGATYSSSGAFGDFDLLASISYRNAGVGYDSRR